MDYLFVINELVIWGGGGGGGYSRIGEKEEEKHSQKIRKQEPKK